ncbi:unnamed protein product, partial [Rotaria sp. Silwood1]
MLLKPLTMPCSG